MALALAKPCGPPIALSHWAIYDLTASTHTPGPMHVPSILEACGQQPLALGLAGRGLKKEAIVREGGVVLHATHSIE